MTLLTIVRILLGAGFIFLVLLVIEALTPVKLFKTMRETLGELFPKRKPGTKSAFWETLRAIVSVVDEVMVYGAMLSGVALSQFYGPGGVKVPDATTLNVPLLIIGAGAAGGHVYIDEMGDRAGKTKSFGKMVVRYSKAFMIGYGWANAASGAG